MRALACVEKEAVCVDNWPEITGVSRFQFIDDMLNS
jgi:hypothetical protein